MKTESAEYSEYLSNKYLPGRSLFLKYIYYPRILKEFKPEKTILDLGCGSGEFLSFCKAKHRNAKGIDSNLSFISLCKSKGFSAEFDDLSQFKTIPDNSIENALIDNVLEHLSEAELYLFFDVFERKACDDATLVCIVPGERGFKKDPTHKTYVTKNLLFSVLKNKKLFIISEYCHPFPTTFVNSFLYLNMKVFVIRKTDN